LREISYKDKLKTSLLQHPAIEKAAGPAICQLSGLAIMTWAKF
jgi:hypothetical protein